jgi:3-isopropylmalate dehydrogenase
VYDLRQHFDLFLKLSPIQIHKGAADSSVLREDETRGIDILVARENSGGVYQGLGEERFHSEHGRTAIHQFSYTASQCQRFLHASARLAQKRRGHLTVIWKEHGLPTMSKLWHDSAREAADLYDVELSMVDVDLAAYRFVKDARAFDVVAAPNLFGDVLADLGASLLGSRGVSFSGNYSARGDAVYQTNHGAAHDLAGTDRANPVGQILSLAMMLRESFGLLREAQAIEDAIQVVWKKGWRTQDIATSGCRVIGTREMGCRIAAMVGSFLKERCCDEFENNAA